MRSFRHLAGLGLAITALAAAPAHSQDQAAVNPPDECTLATRSTAEIDAMLSQHGVSMIDYLTFCDGLKQARVGIDAVGQAGSQGEFSTALVVLRLYDLEGGTSGSETSFGLVEEPGNDEAARTAAYSRAYNLALAELEQDRTTYIASVVEEMARLDGLYRAGVAPSVLPAQQPCTITYRATPSVEQVIMAHNALPDFAGYDAFCEALRARGAGLEFLGAQLPVVPRLHTLVSVSLYDRATGVLGNLRGYASAHHDEGDDAAGQEDMWAALQGALEGMATTTDTAFATLDDVLVRDRAFYPVDE